MSDADPPAYVPENLPKDVLWGFTREGLLALRHYCHPIPHSRGLVGPFMAKYWPGLMFQTAMAMASAAGVFVRRGNHFTGLDVHAHLKELHLIVGGGSRIIAFEEGETQQKSPSEKGRVGVLVELLPESLTSDSSMRDVARHLLERLRPQ